MTGKPFMPVDDMVRVVGEGSVDYADGDDPGYFRIQWNPDASELILGYEPDESAEPQYRHTEHVFRYGAQARVGAPSLGETAYAGYLASCGGKSLISGAPLPAWADQSEAIRAAWDAAADAVRVAL